MKDHNLSANVVSAEQGLNAENLPPKGLKKHIEA
jgi:hypothetical protein